MPKRGKKYIEKVKLFDATKTYTLDEAVDLVKKTSPVKFDASVELHINLGIDPKEANQQVKGTVVLAHGTGKEKRVAVFAQGEKADEAKKAGADIIGGKELIDQIKTQKKFEGVDATVATPEMMPLLAQIAKIIGPKGLMPSPKTDTVTTNVAKVVGELKKGKVNFKNDEGGNIHQIIGKVSWEKEKLLVNSRAFLEAVRKAKPAKSKGLFFRNIVLTSSMGPGIKTEI